MLSTFLPSSCQLHKGPNILSMFSYPQQPPVIIHILMRIAHCTSHPVFRSASRTRKYSSSHSIFPSRHQIIYFLSFLISFSFSNSYFTICSLKESGDLFVCSAFPYLFSSSYHGSSGLGPRSLLILHTFRLFYNLCPFDWALYLYKYMTGAFVPVSTDPIVLFQFT